MATGVLIVGPALAPILQVISTSGVPVACAALRLVAGYCCAMQKCATTLMIASEFGCHECVKELLTEAPAPIASAWR